MNERIRELAFKSAGGLLRFDERGFMLYEDEVEKFAGLIVRECANVALREDHEPDECILRHFGVKR